MTNALKALGNLRKHHNISNAIKSCSCNGHKNENYLQCHTSLRKFTNAILCPAIDYESISGDYESLPSIEEQEMVNITASNEKIKQNLNATGSSIENRNKRREGSVRQKESIKLLSWGPLFSCHKKTCAYEQCKECGLSAFFSSDNICDAERDEDVEVTVRKYENVIGRSRGAQMEIVEVKMNGKELMDHLIQCASLAIPHEWNVIWNSHARQICVNTSKSDTLNLMTDFSAVLDHDVQDKLNTAIPCRSNQCVFLATHSPRSITLANGVEKRIQENDIWHMWFSSGETLDGNFYTHSVSTRHIVKKYMTENPDTLKKLNFFTDGCGEQYKSRRTAYFIAEIAKELDMIVTHNYAPTASFKTMVDGQGNVTKALYRRLERSEEEGTRCPTTYDLFKMFTSRYPQTPKAVEDSKKNALTITHRYHRFLVDDCDATQEMRDRARVKGDVILTHYNEEKWDAPRLNGIKSLFCLIGTVKEGKELLHSREHSCFCQKCIAGDFKDCFFAETSGQLREEVAKKLPYKEKCIKANDISEEAQKVNFFKGNVPNLPVIVAILRDQPEDPYVLGIMTMKVKQLCNENINEYIINGIKEKKIIKKGTWCMTVKFLHTMTNTVGDYYIPVKAKEIKVPINDIYFPGRETVLDRENYLTCAVRTIIQDNGQTLNIYTPDRTSVDIIRASVSAEL